jgi:hypothetical protein
MNHAPEPKVQLKVQIDPGINRKLRGLCDLHRRTPAGQIEHMTLFFFQQDFAGAGPGLRPGKEGLQADVRKGRRSSKEA